MQKPIPRDELFAALGGPFAAKEQTAIRSSAAPARQYPPTPSPKTPALDPQNPLRVLVAEDNATNQLVFSKMVRDLSLNLKFVKSGEAAIEAFVEWQPDIIFMDISMPGMDGKTATGQIRSIEADRDTAIPIIAVTAFALESERQEILAAGLNGFLTKPLRKADLWACLTEHAAR